ncbi:hypothetical protein GCM10011348_07130 [Marinobacterium nitratireducens]|uniref:DNA-3-methyladenine glycosylase I n=1 Tax=Marinobacterium nitratireducens TaxID=518897 RepID=A0A918DQK6_9GAMM|nr:DNA-3-methyladenine glycosylase I [Marinobacterium nitratireducens]GGO77484.1 hypothetical protein GCM10011348_07130 [Marinobacterium nitratireducens]
MVPCTQDAASRGEAFNLGRSFADGRPPTICYAYMQAVGLGNDHLIDCPCHAECAAEGEAFTLG